MLLQGRNKYINLTEKYKEWNGEKESYYDGIIEI